MFLLDKGNFDYVYLGKKLEINDKLELLHAFEKMLQGVDIPTKIRNSEHLAIH